jgi:stress response protein YsnF
VTEIRETREEPVVGKQERVVEEVVVGKTSQDRTETVRDKVRRTEVEVQRSGGEGVEHERHR